MLNWTSRRRDVLTLAHELGHGVHAALGGRQGIFHMATPLTLAETASVFGETIVFGRLLERAETPESRLSLLAESIEGSIATVFRQIAMNQFEDAHPQRAPRARRARARPHRRAVGAVAGGAAGRRRRGHRGLPQLVVLRPPLRQRPGLRLRLRLRPAARARGLRPLRGGGRGVRARLPRAARGRRLALARGARRRSSASTSPTRASGTAGSRSSSASSTRPRRPRATPAGSRRLPGQRQLLIEGKVQGGAAAPSGASSVSGCPRERPCWFVPNYRGKSSTPASRAAAAARTLSSLRSSKF